MFLDLNYCPAATTSQFVEEFLPHICKVLAGLEFPVLVWVLSRYSASSHSPTSTCMFGNWEFWIGHSCECEWLSISVVILQQIDNLSRLYLTSDPRDGWNWAKENGWRVGHFYPALINLLNDQWESELEAVGCVFMLFFWHAAPPPCAEGAPSRSVMGAAAPLHSSAVCRFLTWYLCEKILLNRFDKLLIGNN